MMRSRIASARVGSPITSCQRLAGTWLVISSEPVVDDLEQIAPLPGVERLRPPIVDDQQAVRSSAVSRRGMRPSPRAWVRSLNRRVARL
jgi:hypothetical protein